jgi:plasmid stabilization system protein ParE
MKLRFTPRATDNTAAVADFLTARNPSAAVRVQADIYQSLQDLLLFPRAGRRQTTEDIRKSVTKRYSYLIYYRYDEGADEIVVLNVKHPAQARDYSDL